MSEYDDGGNTDKMYQVEDVTALIAEDVLGDEPQVQQEEPAQQETEEHEVAEDDELDSIIDELNETEEEADDKTSEDVPEEASEEEEPKDEESEEGDDQLHTIKIDGEELEVSLAELKKGYGLNKSLTQKGQALAEDRKKLDAEAEAVAWAKAKPEMKQLREQIKEAEQAIQRGYVLEDGQPIYLTPEQIAKTEKNVQNAVAEYQAKNKPPRLDELYEKVPEMAPNFNDDAARQTKLDSFANTLQEFGYSQAEIQAHDDPRTFLMMQELQELRELRTKVNDAKARQANKPAKVVEGVKKGNTKPNTQVNSKPKPSLKEQEKAIINGEYGYSDLFLDDV